MDDFERLLEESFAKVATVADVVRGAVVKREKDGFLVDIGSKKEAFLPDKEISNFQDKDPQELVKVGEVKELAFVKKLVVETANAEIKNANSSIKYEVGTMIEIPRAALTADEVASEAEFFCFGTNDLTQMTFGFSRDDAGKFLPSYYSIKFMNQIRLLV